MRSPPTGQRQGEKTGPLSSQELKSRLSLDFKIYEITSFLIVKASLSESFITCFPEYIIDLIKLC